ncbi:jg4652 [Pararge aegeria aegeria]|uniref:Jg4652 protein n=1 Tax=Pararge aegeria aegeria TaxID=348720 RepID=A0A8S4RKK9_9NEOP|nr:jg4652 [Pararge aegeria aegeria]
MEALIAQWVGHRLHILGGGGEIEYQQSPLTFLRYTLVSTVKENILRKPARPRILHNVLEAVFSPPIRTGPACWTTASTQSHYGRKPVPCGEPVMGNNMNDSFTILDNQALKYETVKGPFILKSCMSEMTFTVSP